MRYMILKLLENETRSSCDLGFFFSRRLVDAASPRTVSIDKKKISSGTQGRKCVTWSTEIVRAIKDLL